MTIKERLNEKALIKELKALGLNVPEVKNKISETKENGFLWFKIDCFIITYDATKRQKWTLLYK